MTWQKVDFPGLTPGYRVAHTMVAVGNLIYLFGGGIWFPDKSSWMHYDQDMFVLDTGKEYQSN